MDIHEALRTREPDLIGSHISPEGIAFLHNKWPEVFRYYLRYFVPFALGGMHAMSADARLSLYFVNDRIIQQFYPTVLGDTAAANNLVLVGLDARGGDNIYTSLPADSRQMLYVDEVSPQPIADDFAAFVLDASFRPGLE